MSDLSRLRGTALRAAGLVVVLWLLRGADVLWDLHLLRLGIWPRDLAGALGILAAPLIHGSWGHLFANTPSLFVLTTALFYGFPRAAWTAFIGIWLGSGLGVWCFARDSYHIGASGLTHGLLFFLLVIGVLRRDRPAIALALLVFFLYGGMLYGMFPQDPTISFEYHGFGALSGVILAVLLRHRDPPPAVRRYAWEGEDGDEEEDWRKAGL